MDNDGTLNVVLWMMFCGVDLLVIGAVVLLVRAWCARRDRGRRRRGHARP